MFVLLGLGVIFILCVLCCMYVRDAPGLAVFIIIIFGGFTLFVLAASIGEDTYKKEKYSEKVLSLQWPVFFETGNSKEGQYYTWMGVGIKRELERITVYQKEAKVHLHAIPSGRQAWIVETTTHKEQVSPKLVSPWDLNPDSESFRSFDLYIPRGSIVGSVEIKERDGKQNQGSAGKRAERSEASVGFRS